MNYFTQMKVYYRTLLAKPLSRDAQVLYNYLLYKDNELFWKKYFSVANSEITLFTGMGSSALQRARNELKTKGYINYEKKGGNNAGNYEIVEFDVHIEQQNEPVAQIEQQNGEIDVLGQQTGQQIEQQTGHIHNNKYIDIYFNLINKAREKFDVLTFGGKTKAFNWAKEQPEWNQISRDEQLWFINKL